jgi:hypothetical protein
MLRPVELDPNQRYRMRREQARRRRRIRQAVALAVVALAAAAVALGARFLDASERTSTSGGTGATPAAAPEPKKPEPRPYPSEVRGVHVTMALASIPGKLDEFMNWTRFGMTALQLDVKDENGEVAFSSRHAPLARQVNAARDYYRPVPVARKAHKRGLYLIARVVVFEDPFLSERRPRMAIQHAGGGIWRNHAGLGWTNPYSRKVWDYNVDIAESAGRAGFDEVMFDYVRFPSDGDVEAARFPGRTKGVGKAQTIAAFLEYARGRLEPLGVRVSAAVFGLAATRELGIGQRPRLLAKHLDAIYPMVYPSHYGSGEYGLDDPNALPGRTVAKSLRTFRRALRGRDTRLIPWLQDFTYGREYTLADVQAQIQAARIYRSAGFLLWNAAAVYHAEALAAK